jgi:formylglycine-generating enzyme required for sulfatase activity
MNSIGMEFLPVPGLNVLFGKYQATNEEFRRYDPKHKTNCCHIMQKGPAEGSPPIEGDADRQPVGSLSWTKAKLFSIWLTEQERAAGRLAEGQEYRLPWDWEWFVALGVMDPKDCSVREDFQLWNSGKWPPPVQVLGNVAGEESATVVHNHPKAKDFNQPIKTMEGYNDGFRGPSPVGSFAPNQYGLYDMLGNVKEWTEDVHVNYKRKDPQGRILRFYKEDVGPHGPPYRADFYQARLSSNAHSTGLGLAWDSTIAPSFLDDLKTALKKGENHQLFDNKMASYGLGNRGMRLVLVLTTEGEVLEEDPKPARPPKRAPVGR